jgi:hypothetical protein
MPSTTALSATLSEVPNKDALLETMMDICMGEQKLPFFFNQSMALASRSRGS